jgi:hypothetical protein
LYISASAVSWLWSFHDMCAVCMATASSTAIVFLKPDYHWQRPTFYPKRLGEIHQFLAMETHGAQMELPAFLPLTALSVGRCLAACERGWMVPSACEQKSVPFCRNLGKMVGTWNLEVEIINS